jgi:hypothetical protein
MATPQENLARFQEIANRGLQDNLDSDKRARFDEAMRRNLITVQPRGNLVTQFLEPAAAIASSAVAEPIAGLAGIAQTALSGPEAGARAVEETREALTFQPRTVAGQEGLQAVGETLQPVGEALEGAESFLGDAALDATGSPALAAAAATLPTAAIELLGFGAGRKAAQISTGLKRAPSKIPAPSKAKTGTVSKALIESAPEISQLKDVSRGIYNEIADLGVTVQPRAYKRFLGKIIRTAKKERVNVNRNPKAFGATEEFVKELGSVKGKTLADIDDLRAVAQDAASSIDPADARIGMLMIDEIDNFLDVAGPETFKGVDAKSVAGVNERYKAARNLWGRARRAELIEDAFAKADLQASGFENGLRTQLRQIVNNKKRARFFTKDEISAMKDVIKGTGEQNALKLVGRLGFSEGAATNVLGGLGSAAVLGPAAPIVGQISRKLAQRATRKGFDIADAIVRAGPNGRKITEAYLKITPKAQRSVSELTDLLVDPNVDLSGLLDSADKVVKEAAEIARGRKAFNISEAAGALAPVAATGERGQ